MKDNLIKSADIWEKLVRKGFEDGFIENNSDCSYIPELLIQSDIVVRDIMDGFNKADFKFDDTQLFLYLTSCWSAFAGMGAVAQWHSDWNELQLKGIVPTLSQPRGIDEMDEYVQDLIGIKFGSEKSKKLTEHLKDMYLYIMEIYIHNYKDASEEEHFFQFVEFFKAMYLYGMTYEMKRLGMN